MTPDINSLREDKKNPLVSLKAEVDELKWKTIDNVCLFFERKLNITEVQDNIKEDFEAFKQLAKGISACEEILNSQQNTSTEEVGIRKPEMTPSADTQTLQTNGSLDCCSRQEIEENKKNFLICSICNNNGYLCPRTKKQLTIGEGKE